MNAILHPDILIKKIVEVQQNAHARFDATSRNYTYHIVCNKNPFLKETSWYMPFKIDLKLMNEAAQYLQQYTNFESFSKRNTDVKTFECRISSAYFENCGDEIIFHVASNRFLRGMVRALVATLILVGRKKISVTAFEEIILARNCTRADFSAPAQGLFLEKVNYPESVYLFKQPELAS
jgi:tRNA pseudouridine38-40 synthase